MNSLTRNREVLQSKDMISSQSSGRFRRTKMHDKDQKPPLIRKVTNRSSGEDIKKLFEGIDLRTSKSLDLSDRRGSGVTWKSASKRPMRVGGSNSPGIGFSEPVSLKQALRGMCISQAAEMAATKRLSKPPGSPSMSEGGKVSSFYRSALVEAGDSGIPLPEISLVPGERASSSSSRIPHYILEPKSKSANHSAQSSPRFFVKSALKDMESAWGQTEVLPMSAQAKIQSSLSREEIQISVPSPLSCEPRIRPGSYSSHSSPRLHHSGRSSPQILVKTSTMSTVEENETLPASTQIELQPEALQAQKENHVSDSTVSCQPETSEAREENHVPVSSLPPRCTDKHVTVSNKATKNPRKSIGTSVRVGTKATPKLRRKRRLQTLQSSTATKSNMGIKSIKSTPRAAKSAKSTTRNKEKDDSVIAAGNSDEVRGVEGSTMQPVCQRCKCHLTDAKIESIVKCPPNIPAALPPVSPFSNSYGVTKAGPVSTGCDNTMTPLKKVNKVSKLREQLEFSHSSKSSIGDYSSSTTFSEDSNLSGPGSGSKPHMSKDFRWQAINNVRKRNGFLGLAHFSLLKKLGSGDIGTVYLAELIGTNCLFAIKVMDNDFLARRRKMTRAQTEREILRMLDHPFLPTLYAQFTSDNLSCLVMEFCPGGDLHVLRQKQPGRYFPEQAARFYVAEVLLALEYLHMLGIVYRDLKPENIMVREDGHIMLTDFDLSLRCSINPTLLKSPAAVEPPRVSGPCAGSNCIDPFCAAPSCKVSCFSPRVLPTTARARKLKAEAAEARSLPQLVAEPTEARSNSFVGTHEYLAPEIIKGDGHGSAVDWWTLGIFLYELLYGKTPFRGANNEETLANVVLQSLRFPDSPMVSFQARDLIRRLLVKEPEHRFGTETGAAEIKRHPFFDGLKWALIRCAIPPEVPDFPDVGIPKMGHPENRKRFLEYGPAGEHLEFELF